jgi:hypothetical protein
MEMAMERCSGSSSPRAKWILDLMCPSLLYVLYLWWLCCNFNSGPFMKVACFDLAKAVEGGTGRIRPYLWSLDLQELLSEASLTWDYWQLVILH